MHSMYLPWFALLKFCEPLCRLVCYRLCSDSQDVDHGVVQEKTRKQEQRQQQQQAGATRTSTVCIFVFII